MSQGELLTDTHVEGEETVDNETFFNDLVGSLTSATDQLREQNARELLRETLQWVGRTPGSVEEQATLDALRKQAEAVLAA